MMKGRQVSLSELIPITMLINFHRQEKQAQAVSSGTAHSCILWKKSVHQDDDVWKRVFFSDIN